MKKLFDYTCKQEIDNANFFKFFNLFIEKIKKHTPLIIKIILKIVDDNVKNTFKIDQDNFSPLYTCYIFNFIISPRMMEYYDISPQKYLLVKNVNRIIRVNFKFIC